MQSKSSEEKKTSWDESDLHRDMEQWKEQQLQHHKVIIVYYIISFI